MILVRQDFDNPPYNLALANVNNNFDTFIQVKVEEVLRDLLGHKLFDAFKTALAMSEEAIPAKWKELRDGKSYTYEQKTYKWYGMKQMLIPYVYAEWLIENAENVNGTGGVSIPDSENATQANSSRKITRAYNKFVDYSGEFLCMQDSLFGYLYNSGSTFNTEIQPEYSDIFHYLDYNYDHPGDINQFGI